MPLKLYGAGTDSGTFDYFTDVIIGEEGASRTDYSATEDDNVTVQGVSGDRGGMGYFGFSYFEENQDTLKALEVDGGSGCVAPSADDGAGRLLHAALAPALRLREAELVRRQARTCATSSSTCSTTNETIAEEARFVALSAEQLAEEQAKFEEATG